MFYPFIRFFVYLPGNDNKFEQLISVCFEDESEDGPKARQLRRFHLNLSLCPTISPSDALSVFIDMACTYKYDFM